MNASQLPSLIWITWLSLTSFGVVIFGLVLVVFPGLSLRGFSFLLYSDPQKLASFSADAIRYIELLHAVLGSVMVGWGVALMIIVRKWFAMGVRVGWQIIVASVLVWFLPDTVFSLWSGFWQNAMLNLSFLILFLVPLVATYRTFNEPGT